MPRIVTAIIIISLTLIAAVNVTSATSNRHDQDLDVDQFWLSIYESCYGSEWIERVSGADLEAFLGEWFLGERYSKSALSGRIASRVDMYYRPARDAAFIDIAGVKVGDSATGKPSCLNNPQCGVIAPASDEFFQLTSGDNAPLNGPDITTLEQPLSVASPVGGGSGAVGGGSLDAAVWFLLTQNNCIAGVCADTAQIAGLPGGSSLDPVVTPLPAGFVLFLTGLAGLISTKMHMSRP